MKKKYIYLFMLLGFIVIFLTHGKNTVEVHAEPESYIGNRLLFNDETLDVTLSYEVRNQAVKWSIHYDKKNEEVQQQLKLAISLLPGLSDLNGLAHLTTSGEWLIVSDFDDETTGEVSFGTALNHGNGEEEYGIVVSLQMDERVSENQDVVMQENVLDENSSILQQVLIDANHLTFVNNNGSTSNTATSDSPEGSEMTENSHPGLNGSTVSSEGETSTADTVSDDGQEETGQNDQFITPRIEGVGRQGSLVISDKVFNDPDKMTVDVQGTDAATIIRKDSTTKRADYNSNDDNQNYVYTNYLTGAGKVNIQFGTEKAETSLSDIVVKVSYPAVGYIIDQSGEPLPIGAILTIDNIQRSPSSTTWSGYPFAQPSIDLATNLYSGMVLNGISAANFSFVFTDASGKVVDFSDLVNPFITFSSLNGYGPRDKEGKMHQSEFVRAIDDREGVVTSNSIIRKGTVTTPDNQNFKLTFPNVYYGVTNDFTDFLGGETYNRSSVSFALIGEENTFQIGTGGGAGHRGWFTFASAAITPVKQEAPAKTVQPLQQYQADDNWDSPSGATSGWAQRFNNDLDRFGVDDSPQSSWALLDKYRVTGHDADKPEELVAGVPHKADRFVETGQTYFYYINQPTINLVSEGLVLPIGYQITDTLPTGIEFVEAELFDLTGTSLGRIFSSSGNTNLTFDLNENQVAIINSQSKDPNHFGRDFSIRIKFLVGTDVGNDPINNTATSMFSYPDDVSYIQISNAVQIKLKTSDGKIEIKKTDAFGMDKPVSGTEFSLYEFDENDEDKKGNQYGESKQAVAGENIVFDELPRGRYVLSETRAVGKFVQGTDFYFEITETGQAVWQDASGTVLANQPQGVRIIANTKGYDLTLFKTDDLGNGLGGAKFILKGEGLMDAIEVTSSENGSINFTNGLLQAGNTYSLTESQAPSDYIMSSDGPWTISISEDGLRAEIQTREGVSTELIVTINDVAADQYYPIVSPDDFSIINYPQVPLPATGGSGIWLYLMVGGLIIGGVFIRKVEMTKGGGH